MRATRQARAPGRSGTATWRALGTYVHLSTERDAVLGPARQIAIRLLDDVDRTCSRFRQDSDLVRANAAAGSWTNVDPLLVRAVGAAMEAAAQTDGLVDPTLGHAMVAVGYDRDIALVLAESTDPAGIPVPARAGAWREIQRDHAGAVMVPAGCALDLGATAKAWAADLIAGAVAAELDSTVVISLGGDVAVAGPGGWPVAITETIDDPAGAEIVHLPYGGLATSSTAARRWIRGGAIRHHLIDPRTGEPTGGPWRTVTATGATCVAANTASTAAIVLGEAAVGWLTARDIPARLVDSAGRIVRTARWPEPEARHERS
ncbi:MAG: FAD:protein FMN transferase [Actinobacteria bacterium]|nr:FAD:protein FMN transferase [Actinomycetota bacterium]